MKSEIFNRIEQKYIIDNKSYNKLIKRLKDKIVLDPHGVYTISNIYYDNDFDYLVNRSLEKPIYKEKLRLRGYGIPNKKDIVFFEIKKKYKGIVNKRRINLTLKEAYNFFDNDIMPNSNQITKEINFMKNIYNLKPKLYLAYDRIAYYLKDDNNFRITFDNNIRSRDYDLRLEKGDYGEQLLDNNKYIMEIKCIGGIPIWIVNILTELKIYPSSFSKYGNVFKKKMLERRKEQYGI